MRVTRLARDWDDLAELDPLWSILSRPDKRDGRWDVDEFFATGRAELDAVLERGRPFGHPARRVRALDFGCGVGRMTRAMAAHFAECYGLDVSARMIELARRWNAGVDACRFVVHGSPDLALFAESSFDLVYTRIVLQHIPGRTTIEAYVAEFVRVLRPHGLLAFELPSFIPLRNRLQPRRRLYALLRRFGVRPATLYRTLRLTPIRMHFVPESDIVHCITAHGGRLLDVRRTSYPAWLTCTYYVTKDRPNDTA